MQVTLHRRFLTEAEAKSLALATTLKKPPFLLWNLVLLRDRQGRPPS